MLLASRCGACCVTDDTPQRRRAAYRPETEGLCPDPRSSVSRRSPRLRVVARRHHEVGAISAAPAATEPQLGQRHVAASSVHNRLQVGVGLVAARVAEHQDAGVTRSQRGPWRWQAMRSLRLNYLNAFAI
jgi:hypothetical protein